MPSVTIRVKDGKATLTAKLFEHDSLSAVCDEAKRRGLTLDRLEFTSVTRDGQYKGAESLAQAPHIHLRVEGDDGRFGYLIVKRPEDKTYGLWKYHWTP